MPDLVAKPSPWGNAGIYSGVLNCHCSKSAVGTVDMERADGTIGFLGMAFPRR